MTAYDYVRVPAGTYPVYDGNGDPLPEPRPGQEVRNRIYLSGVYAVHEVDVNERGTAVYVLVGRDGETALVEGEPVQV